MLKTLYFNYLYNKIHRSVHFNCATFRNSNVFHIKTTKYFPCCPLMSQIICKLFTVRNSLKLK